MKQQIDDKIHSNLVESYQKLRAYFELMTLKNPGSVRREETVENGLSFGRSCFIPSAGVHIAQHCKGLVGFDGVHLKEEMNEQGIYLVALVKDDNNHIVPVGLALVHREDKDNWIWFLGAFKEAVGSEFLTILSDRQKWLIPGVAIVFPKAGHRFSLRHIMDNIHRTCSQLSTEDRGWICRMARSDCEDDYKLYRSELSINNPAAAEFLDGIDRSNWVKFSFQEKYNLPTFNEITSNLSEQANHWMGRELRSAKPLDGFHLYFRKLSKLMSDKRQQVVNWTGKSALSDLVPKLSDRRAELIVAATMCEYSPLLEGAYSVLLKGPVAIPGFIHPDRVVDLPAAECTCVNWQDEMFPCVHAICVATQDVKFIPWPTTATLQRDDGIIPPQLEPVPDRIGKRGLKPGKKPKHKRKITKNAL